MKLKFEANEEDFIIDVIIGGKKESIDIREVTKINDDNLVQEFTQQPSWYAYYSALLADQEHRKAEKTRDLEMKKSEISLKVRKGELKILANDHKPIKLTEAGIIDYLRTNKKVQILADEIGELDTICKKLKSLVSASVQRKDMLIQLGMFKREELKQILMNKGM